MMRSMSAVIRPARYSEILDAPNAQELLNAYAAECSIPEIGTASAKSETYALLEASGKLHCLGVYSEELLVGFASILIAEFPHYDGQRVATIESIFVDKYYRSGGLGKCLLLAIEQFADEHGCSVVLYTTPEGSRFDALLRNSSEYRHTNNVYCRSLA